MAGLLNEENTVLSGELARHKVVEIVHDSNENRWDDKTWIPAPRGRTKRTLDIRICSASANALKVSRLKPMEKSIYSNLLSTFMIHWIYSLKSSRI